MLTTTGTSLAGFGISHRNGFLPDELPLRLLPDTYYSSWELITKDLPELLQSRQLRERVDELPVLSPSRLQSEPEWQRAYLILSFLAHGYIWGGEWPAEILPPAISCPLLEIAAHLELPPTATYAATNLWNYAPISPDADLCQPENLHSLLTFTGTTDEAWFYLISVAMEARGGSIVTSMLRVLDYVSLDDSAKVTECLLEFTACIVELGKLLERMYERCEPLVFYYRIRPFLAGSKNMAMAGLPRGVFYDEGDGKGQWRQYSGGSNAQSSLIQFFDAILGVDHHATGEAPGAGKPKKHGFINEMRTYMPGPHSRFLSTLSITPSPLRTYVLSSPASFPVTAAYNSAVASLASFRDKHIQIVTRYIIIPSRTPPPPKLGVEGRGMNLAVASTLESSRELEKPPLTGTGGTRLIPFLRQSRDETVSAGRWED